MSLAVTTSVMTKTASVVLPGPRASGVISSLSGKIHYAAGLRVDGPVMAELRAAWFKGELVLLPTKS